MTAALIGRFSFLFCHLLLVAAITLAADSPVLTVDGRSFPAAAVSRMTDAQIFFRTDRGETAVAIGELLRWGELRDTPQGIHVVLADGSLIVASEVRIVDEKLVADTNLFGESEGFKLQGTLQLPLNKVRAVLLRVPMEPLARDRQLAKVWQAEGNADQLLLANGDVLAGTLKKLEPTAGDPPGPVAATLETSAGEVTIAPERSDGRLSDKIAAIIFNPQLVLPRPATDKGVLVGFADGSRLLATKIKGDDEQGQFGDIASHPDENIWAKVTSLQAFDNSAQYLGELPSTGYKHVPLVGAAWPLGVNENVLGGQLRSNGKLFLRGIGMHAASRVVFQLDRPYQKFQAELALDDSAGAGGSVNFVVLSDAGGSFKPIYKSPIIRGGDASTPISLDVAGAKRIALFVEPADFGDALDRANWLDARLIGERKASTP